MNKTFPTLYKKTSGGAQQEWTIIVQGKAIITRYGQTGGSIQESAPTFCEGKNVGRANETTAEEQALLEAQSQWEKRLKKDYARTPEAAMAGEASDLVAGGILPMLAHKFSEHGDKLKYPCFVQPKLDGHRCIAVVDGNGKCTLWSRTRKPINSVPHIVKAIEAMEITDFVFDGELYTHTHKDNFEGITHLVRQSEAKAEAHVIEYHIYDAAIPGSFTDRTEKLAELLGPKGMGPLTLVETREATNEDELMAVFEDFLAQGYEGAIARNASGMYANRRSYDLLKIKEFDDAEFQCVGVEEGKGAMAGHAIFVCKTTTGTLFRAKMKGERAGLKKYFDNPKLVVGKQVTVKYQGLTNANKVPRFPVCLRITESL